MKVLLVDNSKPDLAIFTPKLQECLSEYCDVTSCKTQRDAIEASYHNWDAIVLSGSSLNMSESLSASAISKDLMVLLRFPDVACLGVCFGMQLIAIAYGGEVVRRETPRHGMHQVVNTDNPLLTDREVHAFFSHQDVVTRCPPNFVADSYSDGIISGIHSKELKRYGVQFHPECSCGIVRKIIPNFLQIAGSTRVTVDTIRISSDNWCKIAILIGKGNARNLSKLYNVDVSCIYQVWTDFCKKFRIKGILY